MVRCYWIHERPNTSWSNVAYSSSLRGSIPWRVCLCYSVCLELLGGIWMSDLRTRGVLRRWMMLGRSTLDVRSSLVQGIFIQSSYKDGMPMIRDLGDDNGDDSADQPLHHLIITSRMRMTIGDDEARNSVLSEESEESEEGILGEEHQKEEESEEVHADNHGDETNTEDDESDHYADREETQLVVHVQVENCEKNHGNTREENLENH
ncbi:uncharacterized protein [Physcomitrium patens]|uniref:uncharacterized protein isoform X2 n=1 Tax=Physcomitrium patens TaxID=3218 RepID=UPI000D17C12D|nr:uncharacterized protein LOC112273134 isoform X3 [Physcomitrium patens]|eukprot:XP_024357350.1 uncharacterized protein LOC112273134 isoform X3 [Physcomitrella patens]